MKFGLKGITDTKVFNFARKLGFEELSFDLRPKSFNFTQGYKIKEILESVQTSIPVYLQFEHEKKFLIQQLVTELASTAGCPVGFSIQDPESLLEINELGFIFHLEYNPRIKLSEIKACDQLSRLILPDKILGELNQSGELFGFLDLIRSETDLQLEIVTDWDQPLLTSVLETFQIEVLSWEVNHKVEKFYRNLDFDLLKLHMEKEFRCES